ncbi:hypothetical protein SNE40_009719 [Patella caerulea]|uniref:Uncharacterized protein n=1 Tax=Patella caerulea TaxID=87958 RepID=A0AAN8JZK2_PATCE
MTATRLKQDLKQDLIDCPIQLDVPPYYLDDRRGSTISPHTHHSGWLSWHDRTASTTTTALDGQGMGTHGVDTTRCPRLGRRRRFTTNDQFRILGTPCVDVISVAVCAYGAHGIPFAVVNTLDNICELFGEHCCELFGEHCCELFG